MRFTYFFLALTLVLSIAACKGKKADKPEDKKETTTTENTNTTTAAATLDGEWTLQSVNNEKTEANMNLSFAADGKFSSVTSDGTTKGTYSKSADGKELKLKYEDKKKGSSEDVWQVSVLSATELVVIDSKKNSYAFKK